MERATFLGHSTILLEVGGARLLTDPLLRPRVAHLHRHGPPVPPHLLQDLDAILVSHLHHDHLDLPSLRMLDPGTLLVVPRGAGLLARRAGFREVAEMSPGDSAPVGSALVRAVFAEHDDRRDPLDRVRAAPLGFVVEGQTTTYFAGDTDIFDAMDGLAPGLDLALLPVWGWGPSLGPGHMDPTEAARAAALLAPRLAVPIHWGTYYPIGLRRLRPAPLRDPPHEFARVAAGLAPDVEVRVVAPGGAIELRPR